MRLGRPKVPLILTDDERVQLDSLAHRSPTAPHLARRARIILACAEGHETIYFASASFHTWIGSTSRARARWPRFIRRAVGAVGRAPTGISRARERSRPKSGHAVARRLPAR